jgi:hypothetical protein
MSSATAAVLLCRSDRWSEACPGGDVKYCGLYGNKSPSEQRLCDACATYLVVTDELLGYGFALAHSSTEQLLKNLATWIPTPA